MNLKITDVKSATVVGNYYWTYARVYAGDMFGTGEGFFAPQLEGIIQELGRIIIGENALDMSRLTEKMHWAAVPSGAYGANYHAIAALEIAILDLVGKYLNVPVYTLLGGKYREDVRVYVDTHAGKALEAVDSMLLPITPKWMKEEGFEAAPEKAPVHGRAAVETYSEEFRPEAYAARAKQMKDEGYTAIKFDLDVPTPYNRWYNKASGNLSNKEVEYLAELAGSVRNAVQDEVDIMFDLHWRFNVESAIRLARAIEQYHVMWLEDPVPPSNPELIDIVANSTSTPIATGENFYSRYEFLKVLNTHIRTITPDGLKTGIRNAKFIAQVASLNEITVSPHNISSPLGTMAQAHFSAAIPNFGVLEFHGHDVPIWWKLSDSEVIKDGYINLTDRPGLGIELNEDVCSKYSLREFEL